MDNNIIPSYNDVLRALNENFSDCPDIIMRKVYLTNGVEGYFIFIEELVNFDLVQRDFISHILSMSSEELCAENKVRTLPVSNIGFYYDIPSIVDKVLYGEFVFIFNGMRFAVSCILRKFEGRAIEEPIVEKNIKGSHEGFVETLSINIAILRRKNIKVFPSMLMLP
jgi:spore germination protein